MIHEAKIEFCLVIGYPDGYRFCIAKFMREEDARNYKRSRKKKEYVEYKLYQRTEKHTGEVTWTEL